MKKYKPFFRAGMINFLAYRFSLLTWLIVTALQVVCTVFLWLAVFKTSAEYQGIDINEVVINGFTLKSVIVYFVFSNIFSFITFGSDTMWNINEDIREGKIAVNIIKPISYRLRLLFTALGTSFGPTLIFGVPLYIIAYTIFVLTKMLIITNIWLFLFNILIFIILTVLAMILSDSIQFFFGVLCFYTSSAWGLSMLKNTITNFLSGSLLPLSFFKFGNFDLSKIVQFLPFAGLVQNPVLVLINQSTINQSIHYVGLSIVWIIIFEILNKLSFMRASKAITVQGG